MPESKKINEMFAAIAPRYDLGNRLLSGGMDCWWRWRLAKMVKACMPQRVLDLATGSGDIAFVLERQLPKEVTIMGMDFCQGMLDVAEKKRQQQRQPSRVTFQLGDCQDIHLPDDGVHVVTIAFGIRNVEDRMAAFREMYRVLCKRSGRLFILEFSQPKGIFKRFYSVYLRCVVPCLAKLITGNRSAYEYLGSSIEQFPEKETLAQELKMAGFKTVRHYGLTVGVVTIHEAFAFAQ